MLYQLLYRLLGWSLNSVTTRHLLVTSGGGGGGVAVTGVVVLRLIHIKAMAMSHVRVPLGPYMGWFRCLWGSCLRGRRGVSVRASDAPCV